MGQLAHEAHRVGHQHRLPTGKGELPGARIERDEETVGRRHPGIGQRIEQRGLAGVGVPDEGELAVTTTGPTAPLQRARPVDLTQVGLEPVHAADQPPPIHFELRLTRATGADPTGLLAQTAAAAPQAGQAVAEQRQLHLGLALGAAGVLGEDVEDHRRAVDGGAPEHLLEVSLLGRAQLLVEDDRVRIECAAQFGDLLGLAPPDEGGRLRRVPPLHHAPDDVGAGTVHQLGQLVERLVDRLGREAGEDHPDQDDALAKRPVDQGPGQHAAHDGTPVTTAGQGGCRCPPPCARDRPRRQRRRVSPPA